MGRGGSASMSQARQGSTDAREPDSNATRAQGEIDALVEAHTRGRRVREVDVSGASLAGGHLDGLRGDRVRVAGADLSGASLKGARLVDCDFRGANLSGTDLADATLRVCNLDGVRAPGARCDGSRIED